MPRRRFKQVDVFTARPLAGNPVAVVLDASGLDDATMQRLAAWTNLSETTFVLPPSSVAADYRLRIFTPRSELPFAGHPTVGSAHAVLEAGVVTPRGAVIRQECLAGILPIRVDGSQLVVRVPEAKVARDRIVDSTDLARALGTSLVDAPFAIDVGPVWIVAHVPNERALRAMAPDLAAIERLSQTLGATGVTAFALPDDARAPIAVRSFAPAAGVGEDPVCGSGNASVGAYLGVTGLLSRTGATYRASQGREVGRDGTVEVSVADGGRTIEIGGTCVTVVDGHLADLGAR
jgi:PhzF family phenazine biosynthesis protein